MTPHVALVIVTALSTFAACDRDTPPPSRPGFDLTDLRVPAEEILEGGPPKDGIPAITDPRLTRYDRGGAFEPHDRVIGVTIGDEARAYPIRILNRHEMVNDVLGGVPIGVVFCPLCDSATVVDRRIGDETLEFGVSGRVRNSNVLLYDRTHHALWSQLEFRAISGPYAGERLSHLSSFEITTIDDWAQRHPGGTLLSIDTGFARSYRRNPYEAYLDSDELMFPVTNEDDRLPRKTTVIGVVDGDVVRVYETEAVRAAGRIEDDLPSGRLVLEGDPRTGRVTIVEAPAGALIAHTFWFAWAAFHPATEIHAP